MHPISVLELTNNEVVGGSRHWPRNAAYTNGVHPIYIVFLVSINCVFFFPPQRIMELHANENVSSVSRANSRDATTAQHGEREREGGRERKVFNHSTG